MALVTNMNMCCNICKRRIQDKVGNILISKWQKTDKNGIITINDKLMDEIIRIFFDSFKSNGLRQINKYSKLFDEIFYVIKDQNNVIGYCAYYIAPMLSLKGVGKKAVIYSIAIDKNYRGKGYGEKILTESINEMKLNKVSSITLYTDVKNKPAINLYNKLGFQVVRETDNICG